MAALHYFNAITPKLYCDPENGLAACTICGAPFNRPEQQTPAQRWTSRAILTSDETLDFTQTSLDEVSPSLLSRDRAITRLPATVLAHTYFKVTDGDRKGQVVAANQSDGYFHAELYLPMHEACLDLVDRFIEAGYTAPPPMAGRWTMSKVWDVVRLRLEVEEGDENRYGGIEGVEQVSEPHNYYLREHGGPAFQWYDRDSLNDPSTILGYTSALLQHSRVPPGSGLPPNDAVKRLRQEFERLPQELQDRIIDQTKPLSGTARTCNRALGPFVWRRMLSDASLVPFLWDIDTSVLMQGPELDYELLVRQLAQPDVFDVGQPLQDVPLGLRNRRRIWRVLESMRAGDRARDSTLSIFQQDED